MSAEIHPDDVAIFDDRKWHGLGEIKGRYLTADDIAGRFTLKDTVRQPLQAVTTDQYGFQRTVLVDEQYAQVTMDGHVVGINGKRYSAVQATTLEDAACRLLTEKDDLILGGVSALTMGHGRLQAITLRLASTVSIDGYSDIEQYLTLANSMDGQTRAILGGTLGEVVCANTHAAYVLGREFDVMVRHTGDADGYYAQAVDAVLANISAASQIAETIERMANTPFNWFAWGKLKNWLFGRRPTEEGRARTNWDKTSDALDARRGGADIAPLRDTAWGALMAVQGWEQHVKPVRKGDRRVRHLFNTTFGRQPYTEKAAAYLHSHNNEDA